MKDSVKYIDNLAKRHGKNIFGTWDLQQVSTVMAKILESADKEAKIYDHTLTYLSGAYDIFNDKLKVFLEEGKTLKIMLSNCNTEYETKAKEALSGFSANYPEQIQLRSASDKFTTNGADDLGFIVNDTGAFRLELSQNIDGVRQNVEDICSFNRPLISQRLHLIFDKHFNSDNKMLLPHHA